MPKMKTRKSAAKRYKITAGGKVLRKHGNSGHIKEKKAPKSKLNQHGYFELSETDMKKIPSMLPYMNK